MQKFKILSRFCTSTLLSAVLTLFPNWVVHRRVEPYTVPVLYVPVSMPQQAQAFSRAAPVFHNDFDRQYAQAWELLRGYFLYRDRMKSWDQWQHKYDKHLHNKAECEVAINEMVDSLGDEYTFFRDTQETSLREREEESHNVVTWKRFSNGIGYVHLTTFGSKNCVQEMKRALRNLRDQDGYILDLRQNTGGSIHNAMQVFTLFADRGRFVEMRGIAENKPYREELILRDSDALTVENGVNSASIRESNLTRNKPLIVLVDRTTKSAAEMLAGALRDNKRAKLVGSRSFGKGVIQRIWQFEQGTSIKITAAKYFLPSGSNIHGVGLRPDISVSPSKADAPLRTAINIMRKLLPEHNSRQSLRQSREYPKEGVLTTLRK